MLKEEEIKEAEEWFEKFIIRKDEPVVIQFNLLFKAFANALNTYKISR